jgi:hypothetical protein
MRISIAAFCAVGIVAAAAVLAGCSSGGSQSGGPGSSLPASRAFNPAQSAQTSSVGPAIPTLAVKPVTQHPDHRKSWVSPDAGKAHQLLFVTDVSVGDVYMYTFPSLVPMGTVTGLDAPQSECSDAKGNVWVDVTDAHQIIKLSHNGKIRKTLTDPGYPVACDVDPATGDLAVANGLSSSSGPGEVLVYKHARGTPKAYSDPSMDEYYFVGYDRSGNFYADGTDAGGRFVLSECAAGCASNGMSTISISGGTIYVPGFVQWYVLGGYLAVGDQYCLHDGERQSCMYSVSISGSSGTITNTTYLNNSSGTPACDVVQAVIFPNNKITGSDYEYCNRAATSTYVWPFSAGGNPKDSYANPDYMLPEGVAISTK